MMPRDTGLSDTAVDSQPLSSGSRLSFRTKSVTILQISAFQLECRSASQINRRKTVNTIKIWVWFNKFKQITGQLFWFTESFCCVWKMFAACAENVCSVWIPSRHLSFSLHPSGSSTLTLWIAPARGERFFTGDWFKNSLKARNAILCNMVLRDLRSAAIVPRERSLSDSGWLNKFQSRPPRSCPVTVYSTLVNACRYCSSSNALNTQNGSPESNLFFSTILYREIILVLKFKYCVVLFYFYWYFYCFKLREFMRLDSVPLDWEKLRRLDV